jgi:hypothetical protein
MQHDRFNQVLNEQLEEFRMYRRIPRVQRTTPTGSYRVHITVVDLPASDGTVHRLQARYSPN